MPEQRPTLFKGSPSGRQKLIPDRNVDLHRATKKLEMDSLGANRKPDAASEFPELLTRRMCFYRNPLMIPMGSEGQDQSSPQVATYCRGSVTRSCLTLCNPMDSTSGSPVLHYLLDFAQIHATESVIFLILSHPRLLLPSILLSIKVFSNESVLHIRWPKYWSFCISTHLTC